MNAHQMQKWTRLRNQAAEYKEKHTPNHDADENIAIFMEMFDFMDLPQWEQAYAARLKEFFLKLWKDFPEAGEMQPDGQNYIVTWNTDQPEKRGSVLKQCLAMNIAHLKYHLHLTHPDDIPYADFCLCMNLTDLGDHFEQMFYHDHKITLKDYFEREIMKTPPSDTTGTAVTHQ